MAPEVALCKNYGLSADVFSYSILLWEIISLKIPFSGFDVSDSLSFWYLSKSTNGEQSHLRPCVFYLSISPLSFIG